jgi:hypothetical protein
MTADQNQRHIHLGPNVAEDQNTKQEQGAKTSIHAMGLPDTNIHVQVWWFRENEIKRCVSGHDLLTFRLRPERTVHRRYSTTRRDPVLHEVPGATTKVSSSQSVCIEDPHCCSIKQCTIWDPRTSRVNANTGQSTAESSWYQPWPSNRPNHAIYVHL